MNTVEHMVKTLRKIEEETGRPAPYIELTKEQYAEFKKAVDASGLLTKPCEVPMPESFMSLTIRVKE